MKRLHALQLGACLYVPANHPQLLAIARGEKLAAVRSLIYCTEDSILERELPDALARLRDALAATPADCPRHRFVRLRRPKLLPQILTWPEARAVHGFVLPKISASNLPTYGALRQSPWQIMPTLETAETFLEREMLRLLEQLQADWAEQLLCLRIGGNDLLNLLNLRHPREHTLYSTPLKTLIDRLVGLFKPWGFHLSAPVFELLGRPDLLAQEVAQDLRHGLTGKTAIHPAQIPIIEQHYRISRRDYALAQRILAGEAAIFRAEESMQEISTHRRWAEQVMAAAPFWLEEEALP